VAGFDTEGVGRAAMALGAGRARQEDAIDPAAGLVLAAKIGDHVAAGEPLGTLYTSDPALLDEGERRLREAVRLGSDRPAAPILFHEV
jgi:pyrimidine-nucleoside phosphorylase